MSKKRNTLGLDTDIQTGGQDVTKMGSSPKGSIIGPGQRLYKGSNYGRIGRLRTGSTSAAANAVNSRMLSSTYGGTGENA